MWDMIIDAISNLVGGAGDAAGAAGSAAGSAAGAVGDAASSAGGTAWDWLGKLGQGVANNPFGALGVGGQAAGMLAPMFMGQPSSAFPPGLLAPQAGSPQAAQAAARKQMAQLQGQGLSGASPDFLATQLGLTPDELEKMMGRRSGSAVA